MVAIRDVVAILDRRAIGPSEINREFLERARQDGRVSGGGEADDWKALVVTAGDVYASGISAPTLARRMTHFRQSAVSWEAET